MSPRNIIGVVIALVRVASATIGASVNSQGITDIFGNHFGRPGRNATYDYVVSAANQLLTGS